MVGVTIHFIDKGIDTGATLIQQQVDFELDDTLKTIEYKQQKTGGALLVECITEYDTLAPLAYHKKDCPSKNHHVPGLTHYLQARRWLRTRRKQPILKHLDFRLSCQDPELVATANIERDPPKLADCQAEESSGTQISDEKRSSNEVQ